MRDAFKSFRCQSGFSSPLRDATEIAADQYDPLAEDPERARDVAGRRGGERRNTGGAPGGDCSSRGGSRTTTTDTR